MSSAITPRPSGTWASPRRTISSTGRPSMPLAVERDPAAARAERGRRSCAAATSCRRRWRRAPRSRTLRHRERHAVDGADGAVVGRQLLNRQHRSSRRRHVSPRPHRVRGRPRARAGPPGSRRGSPAAMTLPKSSTTTGRRPTSPGPCGARPASPRSTSRATRISCPSSDISSAPSPPAGSSSSSSSGSQASARASATRFWTAKGSVPGSAVRRSPVQSSLSSEARAPLAQRALVAIRRRGSPSSAPPKPSAAEPVGAGHHVLEHGELRRTARRPAASARSPATASRCGDGPFSGLPRQLIVPGVRRDEAADHVEQRRLAGAVGADHADDLAAGRPRPRRPRGP